MLTFIGSGDDTGVTIDHENTVLLIAHELSEDDIDRLRQLVHTADFGEIAETLRDPEGFNLSHFALLKAQAGTFEHMLLATGGKASALIWQAPSPVRAHTLSQR